MPELYGAVFNFLKSPSTSLLLGECCNASPPEMFYGLRKFTRLSIIIMSGFSFLGELLDAYTHLIQIEDMLSSATDKFI